MNDIAATVREPADIIQDVVRKGRVRHTPCGSGNLVWHEWGDAPRRLVLLHGSNGSWNHWIANVEFFSRHYTVLAVDLPNTGESADGPAWQGDEAFAYQVAEIMSKGLDELIPADAPPYHLGGFSLGGAFAGVVATFQEPRLASLTVAGTSGLPARRDQQNANMLRWRKLTDPQEILAAHRHNLGVHMMFDKAKIDDLAVHMQNINTRNNRMRSPAISTPDVLSRALAKIKTPLNAIWGERDSTAWPYHQEREDLLRALRPADLLYKVIPGSGHWVPYESVDEFNPLMLEFLRAREA